MGLAVLGIVPEGWITLAVIAVILVALIRDWVAPDIAMLGGVAFLTAAGILAPADALRGFVNDGVITLGALFVIAGAIRETGALDRAGRALFGRIHTEAGLMGRLAISVMPISAFLNNTPIVAMFTPMVVSWCRTHQVSPSRFLIPLSYFSILGGACTLIGTSTSIVVDGLVRSAGMEPIGMFELAPVGIPMALVGGGFMVLFARRLLPDRTDLVERLGSSAREYLINMRIEPGCPLIGQSIQGAGLRHLPGLYIVELNRGDTQISPVPPNQLLEADDVLTFTGVVNTIVDLERIPGLVPVADESYERRTRELREKSLVEAVISETSPLIGSNIRDADFRAVYNAAVLAVHRNGQRLQGRVGDIVLQNGDTILLQAGPHFVRAHRNNPDFYLVSGVEESRAVRSDRMVIALGLLAVLVLLISTGYVPPVIAALLVAVLMVLTQCISPAVARQSLDLQTLLTVAGAIGLGSALQVTGVASELAHYLVVGTINAGPYVLLALIFLLTLLLTELITTQGAAVLMFPIAVAAATEANADPRPFIMSVLFAAMASFITPVGYTTNLMVFGPGGYTFTDFFRAGVPVSILAATTAIVLIPWVWPF